MLAQGTGPETSPGHNGAGRCSFPGALIPSLAHVLPTAPGLPPDQRGRRNLSSRVATVRPRHPAMPAAAQEEAGVAKGRAAPAMSGGNARAPGPPPPAPQHGQGGEILKPNLPQQFPFPRSETRDFHQGRAPGASLVPSGGTRSPGFRKLQGVFSLQLRVFAFLIRKVPD